MPFKRQLLLADAHPCSLIGLCKVLESVEYSVVAQATNVEECRLQMVQYKPRILITACNILPKFPISFVTELREKFPQCHIILLITDESALPLQAMIEAGVRGMVSKTESPEVFLQIVQKVAASHNAFSPRVLKFLSQTTAKGLNTPTQEPGLKERDIHLLTLLVQGKSNREIASQLNLAHQTVRNDLYYLYRKIEVSNRMAAVSWARQHKVLKDE